MKVLYLVSGIGPPAGWGTEYIQNEIFELSTKGVSATLISPIIKHTHPDWKAWIHKQEKTFGVRIIALEPPAWLKAHLLIHFATVPILVTWVAARLMLQERFDIVHEFTSTPIIAIRSLLFKILFKTPTVVTHSVYNNTFLGRLFWFKLFDFIRIIIVQSREIQDKLVSQGIDRKKVIYCPPAIEVKKFKKIKRKLFARKKLNLPQHKKIASYFGSLTKEKGISDLVDAISNIRSELRKELLVVIFPIWKGSSNHSFWINRLKSLGQNIRVVERRVNIPLVIAASDVVVLPQRTGHGTTIPPISVLEVLASNTPLIATDIVGNREIVKGSDILIQPKNSLELGIAIEKSLVNEGKIRRSFDSKQYDHKNTVEKYFKIYQSLIKINKMH